MSLDSTSTLAEIRAEYANNAYYAENGSLSECKDFIGACRLLLLVQPERVVHGGRGAEEISLNLEILERQLARAEQWYASKRGATKYVHASFQNLRS